MKRLKNLRYLQAKYNLAQTINQFLSISSFEQQAKNIKWLDLASGIHDIKLTRKLIKEFRTDCCYHDINLKRLKEYLESEI